MQGLTPAAAARLNQLTALPEYAGKALRLTINAGGCSGFEYQFSFADAPAEDDTVFEKDGALLVVDAASLPLLADAVVDYKSDLMGAQFVVQNPNAASGCGCGNSFSI